MTGDRRQANTGPSVPDAATDPALRGGHASSGFEDPASPYVQQWLTSVQKALKGLRVYAENNEMFRRFIGTATEDMVRMHSLEAEIVLTIREDRLYHGRDEVHSNPDREEGIPYVLYRNGFRRLTFVQGFDSAELIDFLKALTTDFGSVDHAGEDLCTVLWRLQLPHLRYFTLDTLAFTKVGGSVQEQQREAEEVNRLQGEIDDLVAQIYTAHNADVTDDELVAGVSINREDLEALEQIQLETEEDLAILDHVTERAIAHVSEGARAELIRSVAEETNDDLVTRLIDILVSVLYREDSAQESAPTIELLQQLFESLLMGFRFKHAHRLVSKVREAAEASEDLKTLHISRLLLRVFASKPRVDQVVGAFNEASQGTNPTEIADFLRALGPAASNHIVGSLDNVTAPAHRRLLCDLIAEGAVPPAPVLHEAMKKAKWFVTVDLLGLLPQHDWKQQAMVLSDTVRHEHPKVRARSIQLLRNFPRGTADDLLADACLDPEPDVRLMAYRLGAGRGSEKVREAVGQILRSEDFWDLDPRELKTMMAAYAALASSAAVPVLEQILNPGFFARSRMTDGQVAAAAALAMISSPEAIEALNRGARTLNTKVRDACRRALDREEGDSKERMPAKVALPNEPDPFLGLDKVAIPSAAPEAPSLASTINARPKLSGMAEVRTPYRETDAVPSKLDGLHVEAHRVSEPAIEVPKIRPTIKRRVSSVVPSAAGLGKAGLPAAPPPGTRPAPSTAPQVPPPPTPPGGWPGSETPTFVGAPPGYGPPPSYGPPPAHTPPPGHGLPPGWPAEPATRVGPPPGYPQPPAGYTPPPSYSMPPGQPPPQSYTMPPGYGPPPGYSGPPPVHTPPQGYPVPPGYGPPPPAYTPPHGHPAPGGYGGPPPGYGPPPPQGYAPPPQGYGPPPQGYGPPPHGYTPPPHGYTPPPHGYTPPPGYSAPGPSQTSPGAYPPRGPWSGPDAQSYLPPLAPPRADAGRGPSGDPFTSQSSQGQTPWSRHIPGGSTPAPQSVSQGYGQLPPGSPLPPLPDLGPSWADAVGSVPDFSLAVDLTIDDESTEQEYPPPGWLPPVWPGSSGPKGGEEK